MRTQIFLIFLIFLIKNVENAKILAILPIPVHSHYVMFSKLLTELSIKGHQIDLYTSFPDKNIEGINHFQIGDMKTLEIPENLSQLRSLPVYDFIDATFTEEDDGIDLCKTYFTNKLMKDLKESNKKYDVLIVEMFAFDCMYGYATVFKVPTITLTSSVDLPWGSNRIGNIVNPSFIPNYFSTFNDDMTLSQRFFNNFYAILANYQQRKYLEIQNEMAKNFFGNDLPHLNEIVSNTSLFLVNSHFSINQARPTVPNFIEVGGLHIGTPKKLDKNIEEFIGNDKFIYFSLGSIMNTKNFEPQLIKNFIDAFNDLPYKVLWKIDGKELEKSYKLNKNILATSWLPQLDILSHPNIVLFITHNGLMSTQEAVYFGVPMLSIPIFADQFTNAKSCEKRGISLELKIEKATKKDIYSVIKELIENPKYKVNALKVSEQFKDRPRSPIEEAIYWIEYVIKHKGAPQLRCKSADMHWYQYYSIDIISIVMLVLLTITYIIIKMFKLIFNCNEKKKIKTN